MRPRSWISALAVAGLGRCQTPPNYPPSTHRALTVRYGDLTITPNELVSENDTTSIPAVSLHHPRNHRYRFPCKDDDLFMLLMLDLSIITTNLPSNLTAAHTVHGLEPNRTTYLHWFQGNLTLSRSNTFVSVPDTETLAPYVAPSPNPGDIPHTYAFYLFQQPKGFALEGINARRDLGPTSSFDRIGFSVEEVSEERGVELVAGMYFTEQAPAVEGGSKRRR